MTDEVNKIQSGIIIVVGVLLLGLGYGWYRTAGELREMRVLFVEKTAQHESTLAELQVNLASTTNALAAEQYKNSLFEGQIRSIGDTVGTLGGTIGTLEKLSKTDKELLQKYSKVYFLNENYIPSRLTLIPPEYLFEKNKPAQIHTQVLPYLENLEKAAESNATPILIISAHRSFQEQAALKSGYKITYGTGANQFSADQGYSEHQLGTTIDFTTPALGAIFTTFDKTAAFEWLTGNAHKYGFILSYPKGNTYYRFEPWHWRFVGVGLARQLHENNQNFYDMDQRTIDAFLIAIFD